MRSPWQDARGSAGADRADTRGDFMGADRAVDSTGAGRAVDSRRPYGMLHSVMPGQGSVDVHTSTAGMKPHP